MCEAYHSSKNFSLQETETITKQMKQNNAPKIIRIQTCKAHSQLKHILKSYT